MNSAAIAADFVGWPKASTVLEHRHTFIAPLVEGTGLAMNALSLHADDDSAPTLVIRTRVMDRRLLLPMSAPGAAAAVAPASAPVPPAPPSAETTQPALRLRRESKTYRRLAISLAIALAFALGTAASFAVQVASQPTAAATATLARQPRSALTRGASLRLADGADAKVEHATAEPQDAPASRAAASHAPPRTRAAKAAAAAPVVAESAPDDTPAADVSARDLLDKGLGAD